MNHLTIPAVDIVLPAHDEERDLESAVRRLRRFCDREFTFPVLVTIADNASTDATTAIAARLAGEIDLVRGVHLSDKGRGRALAAAWMTSPAPVVAYMDVDLSTDLDALPRLLGPVLAGDADITVGSRLLPASRVRRGARREVLSRGYNFLLRGALGVHFSDAQCGFKAVRAEVARQLVPVVENRNWFFDSELLVLAERAGYRVEDIPVDWIDDPRSQVRILPTIVEDLAGIARLRAHRGLPIPAGPGLGTAS